MNRGICIGKEKKVIHFLAIFAWFLAPPTTQPVTTGPPETTARPPNSTSPTTRPNIISPSPTGPVASVSPPPDTTTPPPTTPPPPCNATRRTPLQEDRVNALTFTIANYTIQEVCFCFGLVYINYVDENFANNPPYWMTSQFPKILQWYVEADLHIIYFKATSSPWSIVYGGKSLLEGK